MRTNYLKVFTNRRMAVNLMLGFSSGLPLPLIMATLDGWMASEKISLTTIGLFSFVGLPYTLKFLWAPFLDRYSLPFLGRRTGWMIVSQLALILGLLAMAASDPVNGTYQMALFAVLVAFFSASQDIVIDAYRAESFESNELGAAAGVAVMGARIALLTSGALAFILADRIPWSQVYTLMACLMGIGLFAAIIAPRIDKHSMAPKTLQEAVWKPFYTFFTKENAILILVFILLYKLGDAVAGKMTTPFLIQMGFTKTDIGTVNKGFGMIVTILGALAGGTMILRIGILRALFVFGILQAVSNLVFVALAKYPTSYALMVASIGVENICGGMGTAAFTAYLMSLCNREFTATQYALLTSFMAITRTFVGAIAGWSAQAMGWEIFFVFSAVLAIPGILLIKRLARFAPVPK